MAYFNHAFSKRFLGTGATIVSPGFNSTKGFLTDAGVSTETLSEQTPGYYGFFNADTYLSENAASVAEGCCKLILASSSLLTDDKVGPFHGGYKETNKSKMMNPRYVNRFYRVDQCTPQQAVVHIGNTNYTGVAAGAVESITNIASNGAVYVTGTYLSLAVAAGSGTGLTADVIVDAGGLVTSVTINQPGTAYVAGDAGLTIIGTLLGATTTADDVTFDVLTIATAGQADCDKTFFCDETYYLRVDVKGSPALRFANHNLYQNFDATGPCCTGPEPTAIDSTLIMIEWATQMVENEYMKDFIRPIVFDQTGNPWFATGAEAVTAGWAATQIWTNYVSPGYIAGTTGGIRLIGAYVETKFGNCSFQSTDFFEKEPIRIYASLVDYTGDPCVFEGLCVITECLGIQGMGFGETVLRDFILSESYLQNYFANDQRIREITQGDDILNAINRNSLYTRYYIQHVVPRFNNPSGVFDNDQYMLEIITPDVDVPLEAFMTAWLTGCSDCLILPEDFGCTTCSILPVPAP
tara:strand:- start:9304 stop:10872 length:1569 start_codon:yes stop_codon:yes gene_type:complete